jgi:zinc protease
MRKLMLIVLGFAVLSSPQRAGAAPPLLPYERFRLDNGLDVIVHEDHSVPVVAVEVWYHVGSRNEVRGKTGFAHLFEHMMFQGSAHVGDDQHFHYVSEAGGTLNGTTNRDRTNYFEVVPSNFLERMLWLESDRMGFLLDTMSKEKLDNQRDVVKNERRQNYENRPYGMAIKTIVENIFPVGHPYHHLTIGDHADLEAASEKDVRDFFRTYYSPNNATLVIAGDVTLDRARELVTKWFGPLANGPQVVRPAAPPLPRIEGERRLTLNDRVSLERLYLVWPSPAIYQVGDAELDVLANVLGGKSGRLYRRLVYELKIAQSVSVEQESQLLGSMFEVQVTAKPGHTAAELQPIIDEELEKLRRLPPTPEELERAKNLIETEHIVALGSANGRAGRLANYSFYTGDPGYLEKDLERWRAVDAESVRRAAEATLTSGRVMLSVVPQPKGVK